MWGRHDGAARGRHGWYGKIPAAGDFLHRGVTRELAAWWDKWAQHGLAALRQLPPEAQREFLAAPLWNFAVPAGPGAGSVQLGCVMPSRDRVGRAYPLWALWEIPVRGYEPGMLAQSGPFYRDAGGALLSAVRHGSGADQLDRALAQAAAGLQAAPQPAAHGSPGQDILEILNAGLPDAPAPAPHGPAGWPELPECFNPASHTSYWWTNQADGAALQTYVHGGALNATLFARLFVPLARSRL
ncbi:type VI secretion system-associated protein TagF [Orrella sp. JC864]|uniref:type VI secretion system-associated protein TagF n=1 Tax=Orrella sp. JC864 TaxID=3120298 RepID=UPI003FA797A6